MRRIYAVPAVAVASVLLFSGCVENSDPGAQASASAAASAAPDGVIDEASAALVPEAIRASGKLVAGIDPNYAPNEFKNSSGRPVGWSIDLADAIGAKLGLTVEYQVAGFDKIIPSVLGGTIDIGYSSLTDNAERQKSVDFVNYYTAGLQWTQPLGGSVDVTNVCGLTVSVQRTTYAETDLLPQLNAECEAAGNEAILVDGYETQAEATNALAIGKSDAMIADSPIAQYAFSQQPDAIELVGPIFDTAPYGIAVNKNNTALRDAIHGALVSMLEDGSYKEVLSSWRVNGGMLDLITINAGV